MKLGPGLIVLHEALMCFTITGKIGTLEATRLSNESTMNDLRASLAKLEDKLQWMEKERQSLESSKKNLSQEQSSQLRSLEKVRVCAWLVFKDSGHYW